MTMRELTSPYAVASLAERLEDWGEHDEGVISDRREEGAAPDLHRELTAALAREAALLEALQRIWDHCQNSGIEHATVGMRVIERIEDEVAAIRKGLTP